MLGSRLAVSAVLIPVLAAYFYWDHRSGTLALPLLAFCVAAVNAAAWELGQLLQAANRRPPMAPVFVGVTLIMLGAWVGPLSESFGDGSSTLKSLEGVALATGASVLILFLARIVAYREPGANVALLSRQAFIVGYVGLLLAITSQLRWVRGAENGYLCLGSLIIVAKSGDIGAYTIGRLFGRRKMAPRLSPGKTWAGAVGAVGGACLGSFAWFGFADRLFDTSLTINNWFAVIAFGAIIGVVGLIGDLAESLIKRDVGQKDSAALLPGFGGLLDLLDSVLFAGPVAYGLWRFLPPMT